jgi:deoxycytidine triphosphate deaminase
VNSPTGVGGKIMARILADRDIRKLIGDVLIDADPDLLSPNGVRLRLGKHVHFLSTDEEKELGSGFFLRVSPGETVQVSSLERLNFSPEKVQSVFPGHMLMGLITPTTSMMREGVLQVATKVDAGFRGYLNWGLRNSSITPLVIEYGEPIFKLTLFLLDKDESPEVPYGERDGDKYQDTEGIRRSSRRIPTSLPKSKTVCSSLEQIDPKKRLSEAGYPFNLISTELVELDGKFEVVSSDVKLLKGEFEKRTKELSESISKETKTLTDKLAEFTTQCFDRVELVFHRKFMQVGGAIVGGISALYGIYILLKAANVADNLLAGVAFAFAVVILFTTYILSRST